MDIEIRNIASDGFEAAVEVITSAFLDRPDTARVAAYLRDRWDGGAGLGGLRRTASLRHLQLVADGPDRPGRRHPACGRGDRRDRAPDPPPSRGPDRDDGDRACGDPGARRGRRDPVLGRVPHLRTLRVRAGDQDGNADAGRPAARASTGHGPTGVELVVPDAVRPGRGSGGPRGVARPPCRRDPAPAVPWDVRLGLEEEPWAGRWKGFLALHRDAAGTVDGYARYRTQPRWEENMPRRPWRWTSSTP